MVPRELDLLYELGLIDPVPPRLAEAIRGYGMSAIEVTDTSPLSLAARAGEAAGFFRTVEQTRELVNITGDVGLLDPFDFDTATPDIARINNVPERWMADDQAIAGKRKARADQQAQKAALDVLPNQAAMVKAQAVASKNGILSPQQGGA